MISRRWIPPLFFLLIALAFITACINHNDESDPRPGNVQFVLTAAPAMATSTAGSTGTTGLSSAVPLSDDDDGEGDDILSRLSQVNVTFSSLLARNLDGELVSLVIDLPLTVDLISVLNGNQVTFPAGTLPPGMYDQIVVVIKKVEFVFVDGLNKALTPPGGGWTRIIPVETFEVIDGQTITIELRFRPLHAFEELNGEFEFSPDFECHRRD
jgi:Domain of unknown function (DUF4382)